MSAVFIIVLIIFLAPTVWHRIRYEKKKQNFSERLEVIAISLRPHFTDGEMPISDYFFKYWHGTESEFDSFARTFRNNPIGSDKRVEVRIYNADGTFIDYTFEEFKAMLSPTGWGSRNT